MRKEKGTAIVSTRRSLVFVTCSLQPFRPTQSKEKALGRPGPVLVTQQAQGESAFQRSSQSSNTVSNLSRCQLQAFFAPGPIQGSSQRPCLLVFIARTMAAASGGGVYTRHSGGGTVIFLEELQIRLDATRVKELRPAEPTVRCASMQLMWSGPRLVSLPRQPRCATAGQAPVSAKSLSARAPSGSR